MSEGDGRYGMVLHVEQDLGALSGHNHGRVGEGAVLETIVDAPALFISAAAEYSRKTPADFPLSILQKLSFPTTCCRLSQSSSA